MTEPWRYACPKGHRNLWTKSSDGSRYCDTCKTRYDESEIIDLKNEPRHA